MSRVLLIWELGGGYGHVGRLVPLANALARRGHEPVLALKDVSAPGPFLDPGMFKIVQSPLWLSEVAGLPPAENHAELLLRFGFYESAALTHIAYAWRHLIDMVRPDLMIFDHAPTALLATRGTKIPRVLYGDGFCIPPSTEPWPPVRWWQPATHARLADAMRRVLDVANATLERLGAPPLDRLSQLYDADQIFLLTLAELDHYPKRSADRYWGPVFADNSGMRPQWPIAGNGRAFAYISPRASYFGALMLALAQSGASTLVFAPGISGGMARQLSGATVTVSPTPYDMQRIRRECDFAITQAGAGTSAAILLAGKPQLLLPTFVERMMLAKRIEQLGAAMILTTEGKEPDFRRALKRLRSDPGLAEHARSYAAANSELETGANLEAIADRCVALIECQG